MPPDRWQQHNITFVDREIARRTIAERLGPALIEAEADGQLTGWWFMNKQPWPLRYLADKPSPAIESLLSDLVGDGVAVSCLPCVYEPETDTFGGPEAMDAAHELFHSDSRHLLTYQPSPMHLGRRETAVLLASVMMRGAGLDWFEQGDVWAKVAALRPAAAPQRPERAAELVPAMRKLMTADAHSLGRPAGPLHAHEETALRPDPHRGDGRYPIAWLHITAPGRGAIPTATSWCACGWDRSAIGHKRVHALIQAHTGHRDTCPLRTPQEGRAAA